MGNTTSYLFRSFVVAAGLGSAFAAHAFCFNDAASRYGLDPRLLIAIAKTESGLNPMARNVNANGTEDIGLMQINSSHLAQLAPYGISRKALFDPCTNVHVGAWVLANNVARHGMTWRAVGAYNASSPAKQQIYVGKIWKRLNNL